MMDSLRSGIQSWERLAKYVARASYKTVSEKYIASRSIGEFFQSASMLLHSMSFLQAYSHRVLCHIAFPIM